MNSSQISLNQCLRPVNRPRTSGINVKIIAFRQTPGNALKEIPAATPTPVGNSAGHNDLIARIAKEGDHSAFVELYKYFAPRVKSYLIGQRMPSEIADEIMQEVMLAVWNKAGQFDHDKSAASTWIFSIARNKRIDRIRKDMKPELDPDEPDLQPYDFGTVDDNLLDRQRKAAVVAALSELPQNQKMVIELSFLKGFSHSEISEQLGLPLGTVKSRIRMAFKRLRGDLGEVL